VIAWALDHRWSMVFIAVASLVAAIFVQVRFGGFGLVPITDRSELNIALEAPPGSSLDYTRLKAEEILRILGRHSEITYTYTTIGSASGSGAVDAGTIYSRLIPKAERHISQDALGTVIRREMRAVAGITAYTFASGFAGTQKQLQLQLQGPDVDRLTSIAEQVADVVRKVPGTADVGLSTKGQRPELDVSLDRGLASSRGVTVGQIAQALRVGFAGVDAGTWVDPSGQTRYVHVRLAAEARESVTDLERLPILLNAPSASGSGAAVVPLGQLATIRRGVGPAQIDHLNRRRVVIVGANIQGRSLGEVARDIGVGLRQLRLPAGYEIVQGGEVERQQEVFGNFALALGIAVLLMYLILVVQFGSFLDPLAILISLPLSLIGVVLALLMMRDTLNIMSLIGVVLLMGIVAKNAILLIDFAEWGRERGMDRRTAIIEAGRIRLRPIMMTTLALIAGMIPVAIGAGEGADFRAPLGRAVIGGVITSTFLTLLVIPTIYEILDEWREWLLARFRRRRPHIVAEPAPGD
jgi:HAE1 family hydrophobic/amphiphilic exporter-1